MSSALSKMRFSYPLVLAICATFILLAAACSSDDPVTDPDAGEPDDVEVEPDAGEPDDVEGDPDVGEPDDVDTDPDVGPQDDADADPDGGPVDDVGTDTGGDAGVDEENDCGGTEELDGEPGDSCEDGAGQWECVTENEVACHIEENACGGTEELDAEPGESCEDGAGEWECEGDDEVVCVLETNSCGGTDELDGEPGEPCDGGDGVWNCDGDDAVTCTESENNVCGGTEELDGEPGTECDDCGTWACDGSNDVMCLGGVDLQNDVDNCGSCDNACDEEQVCNDGVCGDPPFACDLNEEFYGQLGGESDNAGGEPTTDPFTHQSGLGEIIAEVEDALDDYTDEEISDQIIEIEFDDTIEVDGATVTAVEYISAANFWLGDADTGLYFRAAPEDPVDDEPNVGDRVSFDVDSVEVFHGTPQIREYANWEIDEEDTEVSYVELGDDELDLEEHHGRIVRLVGELTDTSWSCAGDVCFEMNYGLGGGFTTTFKTSSDFIYPGDCVTYIGPIRSFPRFYVDGAEPQVDAGDGPNFGWGWMSTE